MKKIAVSLIAIVAMLLSCKNNSKEKEHVNTSKNKVKLQTEAPTEMNVNEGWIGDMEFNQGARWKANPETNQGVAKMQAVLTISNPKELKDYHTVANALTKEKNYVIKECTMKGPSHDNLHIWLVPLIEKIDALSNAGELEEAQQVYKAIEEHVSAYSTYFQ